MPPTEENKARVIESGELGSSLIGLLEDDDSLLQFAISVIYNICVDYGEFAAEIWWFHHC